MKNYLSLKDHVYNHIKNLIDTGSLNKEDKIVEQQIANELGVSRTPVREALLQLASDGYLENIPRKGFKIKELTEKDQEDIYQVIGLLDGEAASLAVDYLTEEDFQQMNFLIDSMDIAVKNEMFPKYNQLQKEFHDVYINKCGNQKLIETIEQLKRYLLNSDYTIQKNENLSALLDAANKEHKQIVTYLKEKQKETAQRYIQEVHWHTKNAEYDTW
ncbi:GntR family transcriptional regulator [Isobaculum melis]|uniref:DNA-binding transcriptional regulator, GntR family n=1 Tax=Isobaculum melis TaxID=142588 RepID=A0A1H9PTS1_9LACT|nr:GntR family transcriptional regulator [Isobaculum melis]SER51614.1 DNA-binding transcriptional regulator, GntR family [Isobaculum melis]